MKKLVSLFAALMLIPCFSFAETDLSGMSVDDLVSLKTAIVGELMARDEVKTVTVPAGEYIVGEDIPAGKYSVATSASMVMLTVNEYKEAYVVTPNDPIGKLSLKNGDVLALSSGCDFSVYVGLGF